MKKNEPLALRNTLLTISAIFSVFIAVLHSMGRIPYCECGLGFWTVSAWSSTTSQHFGDPYSFSHILHGILFYWILKAIFKKAPLSHLFLGAFLIEIGWEILENSPLIINRYREATASLDYFGDSILNSVADVLLQMIGFWLAVKLKWKWTLAILILIELVMLLLIRDNLTLNILMLMYPIEAIKNWQIAPFTS